MICQNLQVYDSVFPGPCSRGILEISASSAPMWNRAACSAACFCNSIRSSSLESLEAPNGSSVLRWLRRSALSRCFCWRVCSFWRLVKLDRPRPGIPVSHCQFLQIAGCRPGISLQVQSSRHNRVSSLFCWLFVLPAGLAGLARVALVVVATAATSAAKTFSTTAAAWSIRLWFCFVDLQCSAAQFRAIQGSDRLVGFCRIGHFHKGKAPRTAGFTVRNDADLLDCAMRLKHAAQLGFRGAVR